MRLFDANNPSKDDHANYMVWTGRIASSQTLQMLLLQNVLSTDDREWQSVNPLDVPLPS